MDQDSSNRRGGFTLVEVIVVAVIVAVLATAAVLAYRGFVVQTQRDAVRNLARTASSAANIYYRRLNADPTDVIQLNLNYDSGKFTITLGPNGGVAAGSVKVAMDGWDTTVTFR